MVGLALLITLGAGCSLKKTEPEKTDLQKSNGKVVQEDLEIDSDDLIAWLEEGFVERYDDNRFQFELVEVDGKYFRVNVTLLDITIDKIKYNEPKRRVVLGYKISDGYEIVHDGWGNYNCNEMEGFGFPQSTIKTCYLDFNPVTVEDEMQFYFAKRGNQDSLKNIHVSVDKVVGDYAVGGASYTTDEGYFSGASGWYATKLEGEWVSILDTQDDGVCEILDLYGFPKNSGFSCYYAKDLGH